MDARVWIVRLRRDQLRDVAGRLALDGTGLVFTADHGTDELRIAFASVRRVRRVVGSPVVIVQHEGEEGLERTAFYFAQPPPLRRPEAPRWEAKRETRATVRYLGATNAALRPVIRSWVREIRAAARTARSR